MTIGEDGVGKAARKPPGSRLEEIWEESGRSRGGMDESLRLPVSSLQPGGRTFLRKWARRSVCPVMLGHPTPLARAHPYALTWRVVVRSEPRCAGQGPSGIGGVDTA